jgi:hypothetical protein
MTMMAMESVVGVKAKQATLPIVYGYLGHGWEKGLGRQALMDALSKETPVVLMERESAGRRETYVERVAENRFIVRNALRLRYSRIGKRMTALSGWIDGRAFGKAMRAAGMGEYVLWLTVSDPRMLGHLDTSRLVYDCMDPCFTPEIQGEFDRKEFSIARRARMVFCTAHTLAERMRAHNRKTFLLPNACAMDTVESCGAEGLAVPEKLKGRPRPYLGYMGTIDWRFDAKTVTAAAKAMGDCTFVIVGRVNADQAEAVRELQALPNVLITGSASYDEGHAYTKQFDVGIIPFTPCAMNDAINSVKMYMYLAAGKGVVTTWLNEAVLARPWASPTKSAEEFVATLRRELAGDSAEKKRARVEFALQNTWEVRAAEAMAAMRAEGVMPS